MGKLSIITRIENINLLLTKEEREQIENVKNCFDIFNKENDRFNDSNFLKKSFIFKTLGYWEQKTIKELISLDIVRIILVSNTISEKLNELKEELHSSLDYDNKDSEQFKEITGYLDIIEESRRVNLETFKLIKEASEKLSKTIVPSYT